MLSLLPGPREPSLDKIDHFICPLVNFFLLAWKDGTWFTRTLNHLQGRLSQSVIALAVQNNTFKVMELHMTNNYLVMRLQVTALHPCSMSHKSILWSSTSQTRHSQPDTRVSQTCSFVW
ncbi:hypothetical protein BDN67DRAFT_1051765 [Paxillus ammoniavirescens]|nr:hypothetical protein BDN67DRAFT_1051765 [Paxillus ammoniavirescens]